MLSVYATMEPNSAVRINREDGSFFVSIGPHHSAWPTKRNKYITLNCYRYRLVWGSPPVSEEQIEKVHPLLAERTREVKQPGTQ